MSKAKREAKKQAKKQKKQAAKRVLLKKAKTKTITRIKKKHWYFIIAPRDFNESVIGKSLVADPNLLIGRTINTNLMQLTGDMKKQSSVITFRIINIKDNKATTMIDKYQLMPAAVKRLVRRNQDKVVWSFTAKTKDNINIKIKPIILTIFKCKKSVKTALAKKGERVLIEYLSQNTFANIMKDIFSFKLQSSLKRKLMKIFPVRISEIRGLEKVKKKRHILEEPAAISEEPKKEGGNNA